MIPTPVSHDNLDSENSRKLNANCPLWYSGLPNDTFILSTEVYDLVNLTVSRVCVDMRCCPAKRVKESLTDYCNTTIT